METVRKFPDEEIVSNLRAGYRMDETIKAIYRDNFDYLGHYILANSGSRQDMEDIFQETIVTFIRLVQEDKFRGESSLKTFLYAINRHTWLNELKKRGRALAREEKFEKEKERIEGDAGQLIVEREGKAELSRLVGALGETCRKILILFYFENLPMKEIVSVTEYENEQVVRNKKYKCLKQLEQMINENPHLKQTLKNLLHA